MRPDRDPPSSEVTPLELYLGRREAMRRMLAFTGTAAALGGGLTLLSGRGSGEPPAPPMPPPSPEWQPARRERFGITDEPTPYESVTTYNNYYELGLDKGTPSRLGHLIQRRPWTLRVTGEVQQELTLDLDTMIRWFGVEERIYRMRCVEAWSMVIPWLGFSLAELVKRVNPTSAARFVTFTTLMDARQLPNQESRILPWPYVEGLRIDEATNPLAFLAVGLYGGPLAGQNGAPLRLVVPWKYGFKGAKSLVEMRFVRDRPKTTWNVAAPREYGFYANVNPEVDHPRWSQATERRIGELERRPTLPFNGYGAWVAELYRGMDLSREH